MGSFDYLATATKRVFADGTVWWRVVVLSAIQLIPILGPFAVTGYLFVVMRDAAWDVDRGLPRASESGEILRRGVDGFVVSLVWSLPLIAVLLMWITVFTVSSVSAALAGSGAPQLPPWFGLAIAVPVAFLSVLIYVAWLRAAVYLDMRAGLSLRGVRQLIGMNRERFRNVAWLPLAAGLIGAALSLPGAFITRSPGAPAFLAVGVPYLSAFVVGVVTIPLHVIAATAYGLWGAETDPSTWPPLRAEPTATHTEAR